MRATVVFAVLCVAIPVKAVSSEVSPEAASFAYSARHAGLEPSPGHVAAPGSFQSESWLSQNTTLISTDPWGSQRLSKSELCRTAAFVAATNNLPVAFFTNLIHQESSFRSTVVSRAGAQGIAQFMPAVAASRGLENPFDPVEALNASGKLLAQLVAEFGNLGLAAAAYNAGPRRVQTWIARRGQLPAETRHYVHSITGLPAEQWARQTGEGTELKLSSHVPCPGLQIIEARGQELQKRPVTNVSFEPAANARGLMVSSGKKPSSPGPVIVRRSMPQPSQFAIGLPVRRFAAMATPLARQRQP